MKSRRIILSDDEEESDGNAMRAAESASDLVSGIGELNMRKPGEAAKSNSHTNTDAGGDDGDDRDNRDGRDDGEEYMMSQVVDLEPESTVQIMQGEGGEEEEEFEFEEDPPVRKSSNKSQRSSSSKKNSVNIDRQARNGEGSRSNRGNAGSKSSSHGVGNTGTGALNATGRPRRQAATRAQEQLQSIYSEYGLDSSKPSHSKADSDDAFSDSSDNSNRTGSSTEEGNSLEENKQVGDDSDSEAVTGRRRDKQNQKRHHSLKRVSGSKNRQVQKSQQSRNSNHHKQGENSMDDDGDLDTEIGTSSSRRQSARSQSLSSRKEMQYRRALSDMKAKATRGLDAVLLSSSEEDYCDEDDEESEDDKGTNSFEKNILSSSSKEPSSRRSEWDEIQSPPRGARNEPKTRYSYSVSKIKSPVTSSASKCVGLKFRGDERDDDGDVGDSEESDINDFIVNSEDERAEEEERAAEAAERRRQRKQQKRAEKERRASSSGGKARDVIAAATMRHNRKLSEQNSTSEEDHFGVNSSRKMTKTPVASHGGGIGTGSGRKRRLVIDSDEEEGEANGAKSYKRSRGEVDSAVDMLEDGDIDNMDDGHDRSIEEDDDARDSESENGTESSTDSVSGSGSESELDGPMLYYKVNSLMDRREGKDDELTSIANLRKRFPIEEAMRYYVALLAHVLVDPDFLANCHHNPKLNLNANRGSERRKKAEAERDAVMQASNYLSASRQIENLLCTNRESLIGSGAWNKEFYSELQARPFYSSTRTMICHEAAEMGVDSEDEAKGLKDPLMKCAACNRSTQPPDIQVFLFGSRYNARAVWDSSRWDSEMPQEMFLHIVEDANEEKSDSMVASSTRFHPAETPVKSVAAKRNKQFQGYQTIMNGGIKKYGDTFNALQSTEKSGRLGKLQPDEAMVETWQASSERKRKMIVLSDDSENEILDQSSAVRKLEADRRAAQQAEQDELNAAAAEQAEKEVEQERKRCWWKDKFPPEFTREPESMYFLSFHCKGRTRLYHTLLHYKFRLLMNIRGKILRTVSRLSGAQGRERRGSTGFHGLSVDDDGAYSSLARVSTQGSSSGSGSHSKVQKNNRGLSQLGPEWEELDAEDRHRLLLEAVELLEDDDEFAEQEARRFQALIGETGRRFGGSDEPRHDIWGDEDERASVTCTDKPSQQSQNILKWLSKQKVPEK